MSGKIPINISSRFPLHIEADADMFGQLFAGMGDDEQVAVFRAMVEHMRPHRMQWDYISIEFEKPENAEVLDEFRSALFPSYASSQAEIERLRTLAERYESALKRIRDATPLNTNSADAANMCNWTYAVSSTALIDAALSGGKP